jgi:hypothetical protein
VSTTQYKAWPHRLASLFLALHPRSTEVRAARSAIFGVGTCVHTRVEYTCQHSAPLPLLLFLSSGRDFMSCFVGVRSC